MDLEPTTLWFVNEHSTISPNWPNECSVTETIDHEKVTETYDVEILVANVFT